MDARQIGGWAAVVAMLASAVPAHASERLADNADSWAALAMLAGAFVIAAGLSARGGRWRTVGLALASVASLGGAAALALAASCGMFARFDPPQTPFDPFKVPILWAMIVAGAALGGVLARAAWRTRGMTGDSAPVPMTNEAARYGRVSRFLHWSIAAIFLALVPMGLFMAGLPETDTLRDPLYIVHKSLGMAVLILVVLRIMWAVYSRPPALSPDLSRTNRVGAKVAHILLYVLMLGFPVSGYLLSSYFGKVVPLFFIDLPNLVTPSRDAALPFGGLHKMLLPLIFYLVFAAHVAGALKHRYLDGQKDALARMTG